MLVSSVLEDEDLVRHPFPDTDEASLRRALAIGPPIIAPFGKPLGGLGGKRDAVEALLQSIGDDLTQEPTRLAGIDIGQHHAVLAAELPSVEGVEFPDLLLNTFW